jgi:hypothetical protein
MLFFLHCAVLSPFSQCSNLRLFTKVSSADTPLLSLENCFAHFCSRVLCVFSRGVRQVEGARARLEDNLYEMSKPLTRTEDDVDRENLLKDQVSHLKRQSYVIIRMSKPLTRTEDDAYKENLLKDQVSHLKGQSCDNKNVQASHQNRGRC